MSLTPVDLKSISKDRRSGNLEESKSQDKNGIGKWLAEWIPFSSWFVGGVEQKGEKYEEKEGGPVVPKPEPAIGGREVEEANGEFRPLGLSVPEDAFSEDLVDGFNDRIYENRREDWNVIFDKLGGVDKLKGVFRNFDRKKYEGDPASFIADIGGQESAVEKFQDIIHDDKEFASAWKRITKERVNYFNELINQHFEEDPEYLKNSKRFDELNAMRNEAIEGDNDRDWDLVGDFDKEFGDEYKALGQYFDQINSIFMDALAMQYYANDRKFQYALRFVEGVKQEIVEGVKQEIVEGVKQKIVEKNSGDVVDELYKEYRKDGDFKKAIDYINHQEAVLRSMFCVGYSEEDKAEKLAIVGPRLDWTTIGGEARKAKDFAVEKVKENPGIILTPGVGLAAFILGSPIAVPYAVGSVFAYHLGNKAVIQPVLKQWKKMGVNLEDAKRDREIRMPYLEKIFGMPVSHKEKVQLLKDLHENGLLFKDDLEGVDKKVKADFLKGVEDGEDGLMSLKEVADRRRPWVNILSDVHAPDDLKKEALDRLYDAGILYKSDVSGKWIANLEVRDKFFEEKKIVEEDLRDLGQLKTWRNSSLFLIRGKDVDLEYKLAQMNELYKKGLLFKEDTNDLRKTPWGRKLLARFLRYNRISYKVLPDLASHYNWERADVKKADDQKRTPYLKKLESEDVKEQIEGLRGLSKMGLCFKEDLRWVGEDVAKEFAKEVDLDSLPQRREHYKMGLGEKFVEIVPFRKLAATALIVGGAASAYAGEISFGAKLMAVGAVLSPGVESDPAIIVYGPLTTVKGLVQIAAEAMDETFGSFLYKTTAIQDRVVKVLPTNAKIKQQATFATNKVIGVVKWGVLGAGVGAWLGGSFGAKIGGGVASFFGFCTVDGRVKQVPAGGFIRAMKFSSIGALVGSLVPVVVGAVLMGLGFAGVIAASTALSVATMGLGLIIPCLLFGAFAGYQIAGFTGKDEVVPDPVEKKLKYVPPTFEVVQALMLG